VYVCVPYITHTHIQHISNIHHTHTHAYVPYIHVYRAAKKTCTSYTRVYSLYACMQYTHVMMQSIHTYTYVYICILYIHIYNMYSIHMYTSIHDAEYTHVYICILYIHIYML